MTLKDLNIGETAVVGTVGGEGALRQHFLDMGLIPGEEVTLVKFAPMGDPMELSIHGYELTLRLDTLLSLKKPLLQSSLQSSYVAVSPASTISLDISTQFLMLSSTVIFPSTTHGVDTLLENTR